MRRWLAAALLILVALPPGGPARRRWFSRTVATSARASPRPTTADSYSRACTTADTRAGPYDWPEMESHFGRILNHLTTVRADTERNNIFRMDDPELLKFRSPGCRSPASGFRVTRKRPGFGLPPKRRIPDHRRFSFSRGMGGFRYRHPQSAAGCPRRAARHHASIFNSFFPIKSLDVPYPAGSARWV